jgi:oxygen-independent coproporphyrinogen III oxidase
MEGAAEGPGLAPPESLYVHVPVCVSKCAYCDFFSVPASSVSDAFIASLVDATLSRASALAERFGSAGFKTVYVGGGTPTALSAAAFDRLLGGIEGLAPSPVEWTVEANPESLNLERIESMLAHGVTRVSMGAQSMEARSLDLLGRPHDWAEALRAARLAAASGMELSADLIAGIPARGAEAPEARPRALARAALELIEAGAGHLSAYDLTIEEGTPLAAAAAGLSFPGEDEAWEERAEMESSALKAGFRRYEVSNYSPRGLECRHNLAYWRMDSYIGAGPGAVSTLASREDSGARPGIDGSSLRIEEQKSLVNYADESAAAAAETVVPPRESAFETIMMAFRTRFGLDLGRFESRFGLGAGDLIGGTLAAWGDMLSAGEPWPGDEASRGPALEGRGLDLLNRFLRGCLEEMDSTFPVA